VENKIHLGLAKLVSSGKGFFGIVDQSEIYNSHTGFIQKFRDGSQVTLQAGFEAGELGPVRFQVDSE